MPTSADDHPSNMEASAAASPAPSQATFTDTKVTSPLSTDKKDHRDFVWWIVCCFACLIIAPLLSVVLGVKLHTKDFSYNRENSTLFNGRTLFFDVFLVSADPVTSTVTFDWVVNHEENGACPNTTLSACTDVNVFFDNNLLVATDSKMRSNDRPKDPLFRFNATAFASKDSKSNTATFRTNLQLTSKNQEAKSSLINYPFDVYEAEIFMYGEDATTNATVGIDIWVTGGNAVGFRTSADAFSGAIDEGQLDIVVTIARGNLVRAFCILITIAIWLITLVLFLLTLTSILFGFRQRSEVLIVPVATIFAFTQLRSSQPGAPVGFGDVLDFVGILPCLGLLAFSSALTLGAFILTDPTQKTDVLTWHKLRIEVFPVFRESAGNNFRSIGKGFKNMGSCIARVWKSMNLGRIRHVVKIFRRGEAPLRDEEAVTTPAKETLPSA